MRDIKFRAWDRNKKMMEKVVCIEMLSPYVYTNVIVEFKEHGRVINDNHLIGGTDGCDTAILMQYVGLKDSNGKEIYEGDIVKCTGDEWPNGMNVIYEVIYGADNDYPAFDLIDEYGNNIYIANGILHFKSKGTIEVVGNRYENPELLKEHEDDK
ncbi:hypothetical protein AB840_08055 [Megasphaera cerevisiae DSM 20462]|uniref:YopX protein domain-containing protein n=2 Tax=Megasphaera TaxID=906 RepID=A0A0J6ZND3_9FIRM|nr:YopX family protein [Megasphaera cerevisiae]KMO86411.1 hypothetical protein AB840_08055 [Megasphaera cerevisiae DSM 20462]SJZ71862.1 phage uncharacterized protein TIGR01671 [Megasphaera cerevisiae DSM 20462]